MTPPRCTGSPGPPAPSRCTSRGTPSTTTRAARAHRGPRAAGRRRQPEPVPGPRLQARLGHASGRRVREKAVAHLLECRRDRDRAGLERAVAVVRRRHQLPRPGRPARAPAAAARRARRASTRRCRAEQELLVEYKLFEPAFYATDLADWGSALLVCQKLGDRARVLVDLGHHAQGTNIEQIVALLADEGRLGGFHFNNRKYADDDLIVGSVNPFELFLIFFELAGERASAAHDRPVAQRRGQGRGDGAQRRQPAGGLREGAARRPRGAARGAGGGRRPRRPRSAARRVPHRRPRHSAPGARAALGAAEDPIAELRASGYAARVAARTDARPHRRSPDEHVTPIVDRVDDPWPAEAAPDDGLSTSSSSRRICWAPTARCPNFGGGNTSAKGTAIDHVGREIPVMWVKGSGSDLATMGPEHFTGLRLDEVLPLIERDEMSDEEMVAYLARCQLDPAMPRCLDRDAAARVRPGAARPSHPPGRHQRAGRDGRRRAAGARVLRRLGRLDPVHQPRLHALQAGRRGGPRQLRISSSSCSPSTDWSCGATRPRRLTARRSRSSTRRSMFVNERTGDTPRFGGPHPAAAHCPTSRARGCCATCCRASAAPSRASGTSSLRSTRRRARSSSSRRCRRSSS